MVEASPEPGADVSSTAAKVLLIVSGCSAVLLVGIIGLLVWRGVTAVATRFLPAQSSGKGSKGGKKGKSTGGASTPTVSSGGAGPSAAQQNARGPDLKALIKEQQKAANKKGTAKDEQASHHPLFLNTLKGHADVVHSVAWDGTGTQLYTACEDMYVRLWDVQDVCSKEPKFKRVKTEKTPLGAAPGQDSESTVVLMKGISAQLAGYSPAPAGGFTQAWQVPSVHGKEPPLMMRAGGGLAPVPGQPARHSVVVCLSQRKEARVYTTQGREVGVLEPSALTNHNLAVSRDGRFVAAAGFTAEVKVWELRASKETGEVVSAAKVMELKGHKGQVQAVAFSPDARRMVTSSKDGTVRVWNIDVRFHMQEDPKQLHVFPQMLSGGRLYQHLAYGPGGQIAAAWEGTVHLLSVENGELIESIDAHDSAITCMEWCPRLVKSPGAAAPHAVLATSSRDKRVRLWRSAPQ